MELKTFQAPTISAALAEVKSAMGPGAVILHTRKFFKHRWLGLRRQEVVEITAGRGNRGGERVRTIRTNDRIVPSDRADRIARTPAVQPARSGVSAYTANVSAAIPQSVASRGRMLLETPAGQGAAMLGIAQEMNGLKAMIQGLVEQTQKSQRPDVPEELFSFYLQLVQNDVAEELAADILKTIRKQARPNQLMHPDFVREKVAEQIERLLPSSGPIVRTKKVGPHVVALIGPTGVGKTTTIAKLAANLKLRENRRIGLITIDTYRIAAVDQLRRYADILGAPLSVIGTAEELAGAITAMSDCDFILIDTAGRSPNDTMKLNELKTFLNAANPDEVHLVLSTTSSQESVELAIARFGDVRVDKILFTKLDEAAHLGVVLNVVKKVNKCLSYVTTGQDVPDDIEVGKGRRLAQMILGNVGFGSINGLDVAAPLASIPVASIQVAI